jgi:hypothetical protein
VVRHNQPRARQEWEAWFAGRTAEVLEFCPAWEENEDSVHGRASRATEEANGGPAVPRSPRSQQPPRSGGQPSIDEEAQSPADDFPPAMLLPPIRSWKEVWRRVYRSTGVSAEAVAMAVQLTIAFICATVLHVVPDTYEALGKRTVWIAVTVVILVQNSVGGVVLRGTNRIVGTAAGAAIGIALVYWVYLLNGLSYATEAPKFICMSIFMSMADGVLMLGNVTAKPQWAYSWLVARVTLPIVALTGYQGDRIDLLPAIWRIVSVAIGLGLDMVASTLVMPITTRRVLINQIDRAIEEEADMADQLFALAGVRASSRTKSFADVLAMSAAVRRRTKEDHDAVEEATLPSPATAERLAPGALRRRAAGRREKALLRRVALGRSPAALYRRGMRVVGCLMRIRGLLPLASAAEALMPCVAVLTPQARTFCMPFIFFLPIFVVLFLVVCAPFPCVYTCTYSIVFVITSIYNTTEEQPKYTPLAGLGGSLFAPPRPPQFPPFLGVRD